MMPRRAPLPQLPAAEAEEHEPRDRRAKTAEHDPDVEQEPLAALHAPLAHAPQFMGFAGMAREAACAEQTPLAQLPEASMPSSKAANMTKVYIQDSFVKVKRKIGK